MKDYIKSLWHPRLIVILFFILVISVLLSYVTENPLFYLANIIYWFMIDYTFGIGRREENWIKNVVGILINVVITIVLYFKIIQHML